MPRKALLESRTLSKSRTLALSTCSATKRNWSGLPYSSPKSPTPQKPVFLIVTRFLSVAQTMTPRTPLAGNGSRGALPSVKRARDQCRY